MTDRLRIASTLARRLAHVPSVIEFLLVHEWGRGWSGISRDRLPRAAHGGAPDKVGELDDILATYRGGRTARRIGGEER